MKTDLTPITDALAEEYVFVDNEMQAAITRVRFFSILSKCGVRKRSGEPLKQVMFAILVWSFLPVKSIGAFCGKFIGAYLQGGMNVIYDLLRREDINWRSISLTVALNVFRDQRLGDEADCAFVVDDSIKQRRGRKVEGVSSHFDHAEGRRVMGQQVLQLGLAGTKGFLPIDQQIYIGSKKTHKLVRPFRDDRSAVARDYKRAVTQDKNEMFRKMLRRAVRRGIRARHVLGDTWFGNKENISAAVDLELTGIFMMRRGNMKYRFQGRMYTAAMLYELVKRRMSAGKGRRFLTFGLNVELNLALKDSDPPNWIEVKLVFSKPRKCSKDSWIVLLCTDAQYDEEKILHIYALRWGVEVYFKEAKQNMGWLKEQTGKYTVHYASIHLAAIRYILIFNVLLEDGRLTFGQARNRLTGALEQLSFAAVLWSLFKALIHGILDRFTNQLGPALLQTIKGAIDNTVEEFLTQALQMDEKSVRMQIKAEAMGLA